MELVQRENVERLLNADPALGEELRRLRAEVGELSVDVPAGVLAHAVDDGLERFYSSS